MRIYPKDPEAKITYTVDWSKYLGSGRTIASHQWKVDGTAITGTPQTVDVLVVELEANDDTSATIQLSAGTLAQKYRITTRPTISDSDVDERSFFVVIEHR
jgi:hypothetical protein